MSFPFKLNAIQSGLVTGHNIMWLKYALLVFILLVRVIDISERHELHPDEVYSVLLAKCNTAYTESVPDGDYTGAELQTYLIADHTLGSDLKQLYLNNSDTPHASLYYMLLRVCLCGFNTWDAERVALCGGILNLVLLTFSYLILWKIIALFANSRLWVCVGTCAIAFLSPGAGECAMLVREYQLAMFGIIWYSYTVLTLFNRINQDRPKLWHTVMPAVLACTVSLSSGYLNAFFLILLPVLLLIFNRKSLNKDHTLKFIGAMGIVAVLGLALAVSAYKGYFFFITHKSVHTDKAFGDLAASLYDSLWRDTICTTFTIPVLLTLATLLFTPIITRFKHLCKFANKWLLPPHPNNIPCVLACIGAALLTIMLVQYTSMLRQSRYSFPYMPMLALLLPVATERFKNTFATMISLSITVYYCALSLFIAPCRNFNWVTQRKVMEPGAQMYNLNPNEQVLLYPLLTAESTYTIKHDTGRIPDFEAAPVTIINYYPKGLPPHTTITRFNGPVRAVVLPANYSDVGAISL